MMVPEPSFLIRLARRARSTPAVQPRLAARFETPMHDGPLQAPSRPVAESTPKGAAPSPDLRSADAAIAQSPPRTPRPIAEAPPPSPAPDAWPEAEDHARSAAPLPTSRPAAADVTIVRAESTLGSPEPVPPKPRPQPSAPEHVATTVVAPEPGPERIRLRREWLTELVPVPVPVVSTAPVPRLPRAQTPYRAMPAATDQAAPAAAEGTPAPIEIVIGHIEIRAAAETAPLQPRRVPPPRPALSLTDYLRNREGGST